ncbi:uncharacterized protein LOC131036591 isoform X1 [Cryptomeria japonica]|uniref:uncharacterized protein LOC131036591 isoform X1 n=1 Tax=Cryptomeria japonica TaxID=3369 RepID=UPI0027DAAD98|nr:uncharacterized protein LOC131036591 isoform X1 [Cryptomeria japonica]XP_059069777.1 uncharacterized protein LOC131036591 isoform X1 [Cryptomeria japonica]
MLIQHLPLLSSKRIILASASPRRAELLRGLGLEIEIVPSTFAENLDKSAYSNPGEYAAETAMCKAIDVTRNMLQLSVTLHVAMAVGEGDVAVGEGDEAVGADVTVVGGKRPDLVIGADTVVELHRKILEKPEDEKDAFNMLSNLSGCEHKVYTGVSLVLSPLIPDPKIGDPPVVRTFWEETKVEFANIEDVAINAYVNSGEPMDKAGAYGIQGIGGTFVKSIFGCFFNVMGFPIHRFAAEIDQLVKAGAFAD